MIPRSWHRRIRQREAPLKAAHSDRLTRWLGRDRAEHLSQAMRDWYGPPIAVQGVPGAVWATAGGDFVGHIDGGDSSAEDRLHEIVKRETRASDARRLLMAVRLKQAGMAGFSSLSDLIAEATANKAYQFFFQKVGTTGVVASTNTLWFVGNMPAAGAAAAAAPGGTVPTDATTGSFVFTNPTGGDTQHFVYGEAQCGTAANTLLCYDRIFSVTKTMNSTATEAVTGVPTRYQSNTAGNADYAGGNFLIIECRTVLPATAHNWTVCTYVDQDGNTGATLPTVTGNSANIVNRLDQPAGTWFCPLASGDSGIDSLTQMQCSAAVATGAIDFTIGHPIAMLPCPVANMVCVTDGINTAFNLTRVFDDACLAFLEVTKPATAATTYVGSVKTVYG